MSAKNWGYLILGTIIINILVISNLYLMNLNCVKKAETWCASHTARSMKAIAPSTFVGLVVSIYLIKRKIK